MLNFEKYRVVDGRTPFAASFMNPIFRDLDLRLHAQEEIQKEWEGAVSEVTRLGLSRIDDFIIPAVDDMNEKVAQATSLLTSAQDLYDAAIDGAIVIDEVQGLQAALDAKAPQAALDDKAPLDAPEFTGVPKAPTATGGTNTTQIATTAFVQSAVGAINTFSGNYNDLSNKPTLGTAAAQDTSYFAPAWKGNLAQSAVQPGGTLSKAFKYRPHSIGNVGGFSVTPDPADGYHQQLNNIGSFWLNPPASNCELKIFCDNGSGAGAMDATAFDHVGGDPFTTGNNDRFFLFITVINTISFLEVKALQ